MRWRGRANYCDESAGLARGRHGPAYVARVSAPVRTGGRGGRRDHAPSSRSASGFRCCGLTGWTFATVVLGFWMIPIALDAALSSAIINATKYASLFAAGLTVRHSMQRSPLVLEAFFV